MPLRAVDHENGTFTHACDRCGHERVLSLDPAAGDFEIHAECFTLPPCPGCLGQMDLLTGKLVDVWHCLRRDIPPWEVGEVPHPGSLLGQEYDLGNGLRSRVVEHTHGYSLDPLSVQQKQHIRALQQHPLLAEHAPLPAHLQAPQSNLDPPASPVPSEASLAAKE